jgi:hypothetical protein
MTEWMNEWMNNCFVAISHNAQSTVNSPVRCHQEGSKMMESVQGTACQVAWYIIVCYVVQDQLLSRTIYPRLSLWSPNMAIYHQISQNIAKYQWISANANIMKYLKVLLKISLCFEWKKALIHCWLYQLQTALAKNWQSWHSTSLILIIWAVVSKIQKKLF